VRRAVAFAVVGTLSLLVPALTGRLRPPLLTVAAVLPVLLVAGVALYALREGRLFDLFARPGDYEEGRLYGLAGFALAIAGLALLSTRFTLPPGVFVGSVLLLSYGNVAQQAVRGRFGTDAAPVVAFAVVGAISGFAGMVSAPALAPLEPLSRPLAGFLAATGALLAALLRAVLFERDDPLVLLSVGLLLWLLADLFVVGDELAVGLLHLGVGLALSVGFGALAYAIGAASVTGMVTGILLALLTVVLGGYGWFAVLISFFALGGLASKFRYEEKLERGVAQENEGARSSGNVLANSAAALLAVLGYAASARLGLPGGLFLFAFVGSVAAAMSDTFSSEFGGLYDDPRLVTTLESVEPGTDGAVTWQGEVGGLVGATIVAAVGHPFFGFSPLGIAVVVAAGFLGMTVDSLLGATVEGDRLDNQGVNLIATLSAAVVAAVLAVALGLVG
jgi:uncharacterized protein (TIGR00297 family)